MAFFIYCITEYTDEYSDHKHDIKLRTMTWQKAAWLLAGDQVCLAIMAQSWSLSVLGWVPGLLTMFLAGLFFWITSITMHKYIMKHPYAFAFPFADVLLVLKELTQTLVRAVQDKANAWEFLQ